MIWLLLLAAGALQPSASAPLAPSVQAQAPQSLAKARKLVAMINPPDLTLRSNMKGWESAAAMALKLDPTAVKLEQEYPGIMKAALDAARPIGTEYCEAYVRKSTEHKAALIAERLTAAELDVALAQLARPFWRRFVEQMTSNLDPSAEARKAAENTARTGKPGLTREGVSETLHAAGRMTAGQLSSADQIEMMRLSQLSFARKLQEIAAENDAQTLEWANNPDPAFLNRQTQSMQAAMVAYADARTK
jgi:hypothetical protein